jgi:hypothetical protein
LAQEEVPEELKGDLLQRRQLQQLPQLQIILHLPRKHRKPVELSLLPHLDPQSPQYSCKIFRKFLVECNPHPLLLVSPGLPIVNNARYNYFIVDYISNMNYLIRHGYINVL